MWGIQICKLFCVRTNGDDKAMTPVACAVRGASFFLARYSGWMTLFKLARCTIGRVDSAASNRKLLSPLEKNQINVCHRPLTHEYGLRQLADLA